MEGLGYALRFAEDDLFSIRANSSCLSAMVRGMATEHSTQRAQYPVYLRRTPHPVIVTIRDNQDYIRVLLHSYYTTITGWGVLLRYTLNHVLDPHII